MRSSFAHDRDAGVHGNLIQQNVAADPAGAASRGRERLAALDRGQRKGEMRDEKNSADSPRVEVVMQNKKIRRSIFEDGALHFGVGGVNDSGAQRLRLAFQLERRFARGAEVVNGDGVARRDVEPWRFAGRTEEIDCAPGFRANASALGSAPVAVEANGGQLQVHASIRSRLLTQQVISVLASGALRLP